MATLTKKNEAVVAPAFKNGVTLQFFQLTFPSTVATLLTATSAGLRSPVAVALEAISQAASIEIVGTVGNDGGTGQGLRIAVAAAGGNFGTSRWDGTNSETFAAYLQRLVQASGTHQGVANGSTTVAAYVL